MKLRGGETVRVAKERGWDSPVGWVVAGSVAATVAARWIIDPDHPGQQRWMRLNHAGNPVSLIEGVWCACGTALALAWVDPAGSVVGACAAVTGAYDDLHPDAERKGLKGHLSALFRGQVSPGALKIVGLVATGAIGAIADGRRSVWDVVLDASVVAASANMINLLDLRPGRALKVTLTAAVPLMRTPHGSRPEAAAAGACVGAALVLLPADLAGKTMLGDTGANCLGALLGRSATRGSRTRRSLILGALSAGTLLSERVSFSAIIETNPALRALDRWGRSSS